MVRSHHANLRVQGDWPVTVAEVKALLPMAERLKVDPGPRAGLFVEDAAGEKIGYALRTMPESRKIVGYSGPSDVLVVFDTEDKGIGVAVRHSYDTPSHVEDVTRDFIFMERWNGRTWDDIAEITDLHEAGIYGVSGATRTSDAVAQSITHRLALAAGGEGMVAPFRFGWRDGALLGILGLGCLFAFWKAKSFQRWRWVYSVGTILGLGFWLGDLIAQSLLVGWVESRVPWEATPGLVLFVAAAFLLPWFTKQPVYCQFICPHGNLQRLAMKVIPATWKRPLRDDGKWVARWIPVMLLAVVLAVSFLQLDLDLAGIEPFDAYLLKGAGLATIAVALIGLAISLFYPMAYCKFGCPTGWLLEFVRRRAGKDRFSERDWMGLVLFALALALYVVPLRVFLG
ncbi:MAG: 4Fe-4S binding protein [Verrucomicrobiales bacterium]|jgi:NosR/NirI family transcriptional regulator, nitrous oxide reductase regulator|nr:4Fe-4S binding protein [Verrucomicrobiales bacterium]MDP4790416.1 4Fe-4S binding protein [Verrucomicrobiales bacterium]MDP4939709.1 4Fe-4S binding protein [Verrucomicrobiales bacterium]MDP5006509.1 4Fe-4S binding protein [Verrucomicrobiales bacterium]